LFSQNLQIPLNLKSSHLHHFSEGFLFLKFKYSSDIFSKIYQSKIEGKKMLIMKLKIILAKFARTLIITSICGFHDFSD